MRVGTDSGSIIDFQWNPNSATPDLFAVACTDGSLAVVQLDAANAGAGAARRAYNILGSHTFGQHNVKCVCWSPRGKQLVMGLQNGTLLQLTPDMKIARHIACPTPQQITTSSAPTGTV